MIADKTSQAQQQYDEPYRPQFHFSPPTQWVNDPNGLVYYEGEYHLFYQYHPESTVWGPMHWGHAISRDLVRWENLPIALYPDEIGPIWSGGAVVDSQNTSGLVPGGGPIAIFSYQDQSQGIAYSTDKGRTWTYYDGNPVIPSPGSDFRDPKVFWHAESGQWVMVISKGVRVQIYNSPNLIDWTLASEFGVGHGSQRGPWEVPDLFPLMIDGQTKWVLLVSAGGAPAGGIGIQYFIGDFDGETFTDENSPMTTLWLDYGPDNYAGTTWNDTPDGERVYIGWMNNWAYAREIPTSTWRGAMTLPRELSLENTSAGIQLVQKPVEPLQTLRGEEQHWPDVVIEPGQNLLGDVRGNTFEIDAEFERGTAPVFGFKVLVGESTFTDIRYDVGRETLFVNRLNSGNVDFHADFAGVYAAPLTLVDGRLRLHIFIDRSSVEVFGNDGDVAITAQVFPDTDGDGLELYVQDGDVKLVSLAVYPLESIWS